MKKQGLLILTGVTFLVVAAASLAVKDRTPTSAGPGESQLLFADLPVNDVSTLEVIDGEGSLTIVKSGEDWTLVERGGYPVGLDKVKQAVVGVSQLLIEEPKTSRPENFAKLGVEEPGAAESEARKLTLKDASGSELASVILGESKFRQGSQALFVRRDGEDQVYLCEGRLQVDSQPTSWITTELLRLAGDRVSGVTVVHPDGEEVRIARDPENESQFLLENTPPEREEKFAGVANSVGTALSYLSLEDVRAAGEVDLASEPIARSTFRCEDGLVVVAETARFEEGTWLRLVASYEEPAEAIGPVDETGEEAEDGAEAGPDSGTDAATDAPDPDVVRAEVDDLNGLWGPWAYKIQDYKGEVLARRLEDLLAEVVPEVAPGDGSGQPTDGALDLDALLQGAAADEEPANEDPGSEESGQEDPAPEDG